MDEFPPNNGRAKREPQERKKVEKVVSGDVVRRKKPLGRRIIETFFGSPDARGVAQYLAQDVIVPMTKDLITDVVTQGIERTLYGEVQSRGSTVRNRSSAGYTPYNRYTSGGGTIRGRQDERPAISARGRARHEFDELVFPTKTEAEEVLDRLFLQVEKYGSTTVAEFYEACGQSAHFVDENWGWDDLSTSAIVRVHGGGYVIKFPPTTDSLR